MKGLAVLVLRYKQPGQREFRVPLNLKIGECGDSARLGPDYAGARRAVRHQSLHQASGHDFGRGLYAHLFCRISSYREKITRKAWRGPRGARSIQPASPADDLTPEAVGVRPGNVLVMVRNYNTLYNLGAILRQNEYAEAGYRRAAPAVCSNAPRRASTNSSLSNFSAIEEQELFTRALNLAEKSGKTIHLAVAPATEKWDGILRAAQSLAIIDGRSGTLPPTIARRRSAHSGSGLGSSRRSPSRD